MARHPTNVMDRIRHHTGSEEYRQKMREKQKKFNAKRRGKE